MTGFAASGTLAAVDALEAYRRGMYGDSDPDVTRKIVLGATVVAAFWLGLYLWDRRQKRLNAEAAAAAASLWGELSAAHGLSAAERASLERLSAEAKLDPPESVFARPEVIAERAAAEPESPLWPKLAQKLYGA